MLAVMIMKSMKGEGMKRNGTKNVAALALLVFGLVGGTRPLLGVEIYDATPLIESRSISFENPTGEMGMGGVAKSHLGVGRFAHMPELGLVDRKRVADVVQTQRVCRMPVDQRENMAGTEERAGVAPCLRTSAEIMWLGVRLHNFRDTVCLLFTGRDGPTSQEVGVLRHRCFFHMPVDYRQTTSRPTFSCCPW